MNTRRQLRSAAPYVALLILVLLVYSNTLPNGFVWDDEILIVDNHLIGSWRHTPALFVQSYFDRGNQGALESNYYRPLISLSCVIDYSIWGLRPWGFHLTNILVHCLNVLLFFSLFKRLCEDERAAFLAGLLYAVSPIHTNAVSYIMGRTDLFASLFFLGSMALYVSFRRPGGGGKPWRLAGSLAFFCLSLLCKESSATLPLIVVLYDVCFTDRFSRGRYERGTLLTYAPYVALLAGYLSLRGYALRSAPDFAIHSFWELLYRLATIAKIVVSYWVLVLFPVRLSYERSIEVVSSVVSPSFLLSAAALCIALLLLIRWWRCNRRLFFCLLWFFITFAPASNLLPVFPSVASTHLYNAEHYIYLPSMGLFVLAASFLSMIAFSGADAAQGKRRRRYSYLSLALLIVFQFSVLTIRRNTDWRSSLSFYESSLATNPNSARIMNNLGILYMEQREYQKALALFESALSIRPDFVNAHNNVAAMYEDLGFGDKAEASYRKALSLDKKNLRARLGLGKLLARAGRLEESKRQFALLSGWYPTLSAAHHELGRLLAAEGSYREALAEFEQALETAPNPDVVLNSIGIIYAKENQLETASRYFKRALEGNPDSYQAHVNLGNIYLVQGLDEEALEEYEEALRVGPELPMVRQRIQELRAR